MDVWVKKLLRFSLVCVCSLLPQSAVFATAYTYPGTNPPLLFTAGANDSLTVTSGTMATTSSTGYTVSFAQSGDATGSITVNSGATLQYSGSNTTGSAILFSAQSSSVIVQTITNNGKISSNTGLFAIYLHNSENIATNHNSAVINNAGTIVGGIYVSGLYDGTTLNIYNNGSINGTITAGGGNLNMNIGQNNLSAVSPTTYTTLGTLQNINNFRVFNGSVAYLKLVDSATSIGTINGTITVDAGGVFTLNGSLSGTANVSNSGTVNLSANLATTGTFTTNSGGVTNIYEAVTVSSSNYVVSAGGTHYSVLTDSGNYGNVTFSTATPNINTFAVSYAGGYFPGGTYTLATSNAAMTVSNFSAPPASTLFLSFSTPAFSDGTHKKVQITLTRTPFNQLATTALTQQVGAALESVGNSSNVSADMLTILDAVEASTTVGELNYALSQLEPLASAPLYGLDIQVQNLNQVELRLAEIRRENRYVAGDISHQYTVWLRGYGDSANQQPLDDIMGYYATTGGAALGIDRLIDTGFIIGGAFSYCLSHVTDKRDFSSLTNVKSYQAMLYGSYNLDSNRYVDWIVGASANNYVGSRNINLNGLYLTANSSYSSQQFSAKGTWGKTYSLFDFLQFTPETSLMYSYAKQYPYTETNAGGANLIVNRDNSNLLTAGLIGKIAIPLDLNPGICFPEAKIGGFYNIVNGKQNTIGQFAQGGSQFVTAMTLQRTALVFGLAVTFAVIDKFEVKINYEHTIEDRFTDNAGYINLKYTI